MAIGISSDWGYECDDCEDLKGEVEKLRIENARLRKQVSDASWREYPEAMGR